MGIMGFAEIMDRGIAVLRKYLKSIIFYNIGMGIISFILIFIFVFSSLLLLIPGTMYGNVGGIYVYLFIIVVTVLSVSFSVSTGIIKISAQDYGGEKVYAYDAIKTGFKKLPVVFGFVFMAALVFVPVAAVAIRVFEELTSSISTGLAGLMEAGDILQLLTILFLGIIFALTAVAYLSLFSFCLQAIALENLGPLEAIKRSYILLKGSYLKLVGYNLLIYGSVAVINLSIQSFWGLIISILFIILRFLNIQQEFLLFFSSIFNQLQWPTSILSWLIITPLNAIMLTVLYFNQRFKKEGYDILLRVKEIKEKQKG